MFIAEIGINHNGDLDTALELIDVAYECGADVVKFQKRNPDVCVPEHQKTVIRDTPWGRMTYLDYKKRIEFGKAEYDLIDCYCKKLGIPWTASVFDIDSLDFIMKYNVPFIKIASSSITDIDLLIECALTDKDIILSTGMSTKEEIEQAIEFFDWDKLTLMHCVSTYPTPDHEVNIAAIQTLQGNYSMNIGYSGHEDSIYPSIIAAVFGATVIERHITLDKEMWGTDQSNSLEPHELYELIKTLKRIPNWIGDGELGMSPSEFLAKKKLRK